ncbi:hypothetical protein OPT61_g6738 [Boeremia exigua]|uniref:Uncharacterized protein n=1 Tax=Boeremia exigua TaxID=749465 RepID=A0ACC2I4W3_9PLEO|nr:hypothetical protein OPT61_g6738 [Boeremia exigua]
MLSRRLVGMKEIVSQAAALQDAASAPKSKARWPLSFKIVPPPKQGLEAVGVSTSKEQPKKRWWSHLMYRGPNNELVKVLYSKTKADSEVLAKQFLEEKVVGFDMEWPWDDWRRPNKLQNKIGLIQVATEDRVALFHIGLHTGTTTDEIIAPSLRKLIESPAIGKIGVGIFKADFARISRHFKLQPKGAVELSHLHRLVTFGGWKPQMVSTKLTSLAHQVEKHLGHPLYKGDVRTSDWSKPLSQEQINYAAGDAYAGVMLYHCMNYKRLQMKPIPPMPIHAEKYVNIPFTTITSLYLEPLEEGGKIMTSAFFFGVPTATEDMTKPKSAPKTSTTAAKAAKTTSPSTSKLESPSKTRSTASKAAAIAALDASSQALFYEFVEWRSAVAAEAKLPEYRIMNDHTLMELSAKRPMASKALLNIYGIGPKKEEAYGKQIFGIILRCIAKDSSLAPGDAVDASKTSNDTVEEIPTTSKRSLRSPRRKVARSETPDSSPAFGTPPPPRTAQLHTGVSFALAEWKLADELSDDSLPSIDFGSSRRTSGQKRKRTDSPSKAAVRL